jgi:hypothetical protein
VIPRELRTERLLLRQWREDDAEPLTEIYAQPEFLEHMPVVDLEGTRAQLARFASPAAARRSGVGTSTSGTRSTDPLLHSFTVPGGDGAARPPLTVRSGAR